jgi:hypothetical protein
MGDYALCRYLISQHPEVEAKVVAELDRLGLLATPERPRPRPLEFPDLNQLSYLSCVIKVQAFVHSLKIKACLPPQTVKMLAQHVPTMS